MARKLPSLKALRAFEAAARHRSFTAAAEELFVTHAAISRHVRDLEAWLKVKLFVRTGRGVDLTEIGAKYLSDLTPAFDRMARATQHVLESAQGEKLSISAEDAFASLWLVQQLGDFTSRYPDIDLEIDPNDDYVNFRAGSVDLAIRYGRGEWTDVDMELLVETYIFPVCSPDLIKGHGVTVPQDIAGFTLLHEETRRWWEIWLEAEGVRLPRAARGPMFQGHLALEAAAAGQGFALADQVLSYEALKEGWLIKPFSGGHHEGAYYIVSPRNAPDSAAAQAFRTWLHERIEETQAWFGAYDAS
jgi:LysR family glycine cleavage system transcriptional activator